jgi:uncharacterized YigZ family protein
MPVYSFLTIQFPAQGTFKEKGSKFLAFAYPVQSETQIKDQLLVLRKEYFDARHHCYAWMLGADKKLFRAMDDGEPNHSAGDPILGQIKSKELTDVLVVVVRYFGGVKLGVGGLISAYKIAAEEALNNAVIIEKEVLNSFMLSYDYASTPEVMRLVKEFDLSINDQQFGERCTLRFSVRTRNEDEAKEKITLLKALGHSLQLTAG